MPDPDHAVAVAARLEEGTSWEIYLRDISWIIIPLVTLEYAVFLYLITTIYPDARSIFLNQLLSILP